MFNMMNENFSTDANETEDIISQMHFELIKEEIEEQINNTFTKSKMNFLELYRDRYKYFKEEYADNEEFIQQLKAVRNQTYEKIIELIADKFNLNYEEINPKRAKDLYEFFVLNYDQNVTAFIINFIIAKRKWIVTEIKNSSTSRTRDTSYVSTKELIVNQQEALIVTQANKIIFDIIPTAFDNDDDTEFLKYIVDYDDTSVNVAIRKLFMEKHSISCADNLLDQFLGPVLRKEDGYTEIKSTVVTELYNIFAKNVKEFSIVD